MEFSCTHCGVTLSAPESAVGRQGKCSQCDTQFTIPAPPAAVTGTSAELPSPSMSRWSEEADEEPEMLTTADLLPDDRQTVVSVEGADGSSLVWIVWGGILGSIGLFMLLVILLIVSLLGSDDAGQVAAREDATDSELAAGEREEAAFDKSADKSPDKSAGQKPASRRRRRRTSSAAAESERSSAQEESASEDSTESDDSQAREESVEKRTEADLAFTEDTSTPSVTELDSQEVATAEDVAEDVVIAEKAAVAEEPAAEEPAEASPAESEVAEVSGDEDVPEAVSPSTDVPWQVVADPSPADQWVVARGWKRDFENSYQRLAISPSRRMLLIKVKNTVMSLDLTNGREIASREAKKWRGARYAVRDDGLYMASINGSLLKVDGLTKDARSSEFEVGRKPAVKRVIFSGDGTLWAVQPGKEVITLRHFDVERGRAIDALEIEKPADHSTDEYVVFSPGGKSIVLNFGGRPWIFDSETGQQLGVAEAVEGSDQLSSFVFSADGEKLAGFGTHSKLESRLAVWNVADGRLEQVHTYLISSRGRSSSRKQKGRTLAWFRGQVGWVLWGHLIVEATSGEVAWEVPAPQSTEVPQMILPPNYVVESSRVERKWRLSAKSLPPADLEEALAFVRGGGRLPDLDWPELTRTTLEGVRTIATPVEPVAWQVELDPLPEPRASDEEPILIRRAIGNLREAYFANHANQIVMSWRNVDLAKAREERKKKSGAKNKSKSKKKSNKKKTPPKTAVRVISSTGSNGPTLLLTDQHALLATDPTADQILVGRNPGSDVTDFDNSRVELWSMSSRKLLAAWRPFDEAGHIDERGVWQSGFLDGQHVFTTNIRRQTVVWSVPACQAEYALEGFSRVLSTTPGGRYLLVADPLRNQLVWIESATGKICGVVPCRGLPAGVAFDSAGKRLAVWSRPAETGSVEIFDLQTGQRTQGFAIPHDGRSECQWLGDNFVLAGSMLVDLNKEGVVWKYKYPKHWGIQDSFHDRFWMIAHDKEAKKPGHYLSALTLPTADDQDRFAEVDPKQTAILAPQGSASVRVTLTGQSEGLSSKKIQARITKALEANEVTIDAKAKVKVRLTISSKSTGLFGKLMISGTRGQRWQATHHVPLPSASGGDGKATLGPRRREAVKLLLDGIPIPRYIYSSKLDDSIGVSEIVWREEE